VIHLIVAHQDFAGQIHVAAHHCVQRVAHHFFSDFAHAGKSTYGFTRGAAKYAAHLSDVHA